MLFWRRSLSAQLCLLSDAIVLLFVITPVENNLEALIGSPAGRFTNRLCIVGLRIFSIREWCSLYVDIDSRSIFSTNTMSNMPVWAPMNFKGPEFNTVKNMD